MASVREALAAATRELTAAGCETPRLDAEVLLADVLGVDRARLVLRWHEELRGPAADAFASRVARREAREPVAYIVGRRAFWTLDLLVDPRVFIPTPETEHVVEAALELPAGLRVVDVGTGSGAVALALKASRPDLRVVGVDSSRDALEVARANGARLGIEVEWVEGDVLDPVNGPIDAVVSNPPYVEADAALPPEVSQFLPPAALFAGADGLDVHRRLLPGAAERGAGFVAVEVGATQAAAVAELARVAGFADVDVRRDLAGHERVVVARSG